MKKIVLSLAGVLAATAFAPEASAIPAYARQVSMACTACHAQHFPILNGFGRAFKAGGYTMMGSQGKVEGEHLSIPDTLNMSMIVKLRYQDNNQAGNDGTLGKAATSQNKGEGQWQFFDEFALLIGGRVADNVGLFFEGQMLDGAAPLLGIARMPFVFDMGAAKLSVVPFVNDGGSVMVGYELSSGGVLRANRWSEHRKEVSAVQYNSSVEAATGFAFAAQNDMGFINYTRWAANFGPDGAAALSSNYVRVAATPTVGDWAMVVGAGKMSGSSYNAGLDAEVVTDQTFFDLQAQGEVGGRELAVYAQHSEAPVAAGKVSAYNSKNKTDRKAWTLGVDYTVIPHALSIGAAYRSADNGAAANVNGDDAWTVQAIYDLYQNVALHAVYSKSSGSAHTATTENNLMTLMLEMAW